MQSISLNKYSLVEKYIRKFLHTHKSSLGLRIYNE